jgi:hypothetical protein
MEVEGLHGSNKGLGKIRGTPFATMEITKNFCSLAHINKGDSKLRYMLWLHDIEYSN